MLAELDAESVRRGQFSKTDDDRTSQQRYNDTVQGIGPNEADKQYRQIEVPVGIQQGPPFPAHLTTDGAGNNGGVAPANDDRVNNSIHPAGQPAGDPLGGSEPRDPYDLADQWGDGAQGNYDDWNNSSQINGDDWDDSYNPGWDSSGQINGDYWVNDYDPGWDSSQYVSGDYWVPDYYGGGWDTGFFGGDDWGWPVLLDLDGTDGVEITPLGSSNVFMDMAGDSYKHRTAWAGAGDGVLVYDVGNDGIINQRNEIVFTDWDPSAGSDFEALHVYSRKVADFSNKNTHRECCAFDTNNDGNLSAADANFANFKIMKTNADGTTTLVSLASENIVSINLIADKTLITLEDGSQITGQTTFTRSVGNGGTAADVGLRYDAQGYAVSSTTATLASGATATRTLARFPSPQIC